MISVATLIASMAVTQPAVAPARGYTGGYSGITSAGAGKLLLCSTPTSCVLVYPTSGTEPALYLRASDDSDFAKEMAVKKMTAIEGGSSVSYLSALATNPGLAVQRGRHVSLGGNVPLCWNASQFGVITGHDACMIRTSAGVLLLTGPEGTESTTIQYQDPGTRPACDASTRGLYWHDFGGAGVADSVAVCAKDAADAYGWRVIY